MAKVCVCVRELQEIAEGGEGMGEGKAVMRCGRDERSGQLGI